MFQNLGQIASLLKNAGQIKENMQAMQERLKQARFVGEAGGGQAKATVDGRGEIVALQLDPALVESGDRELIEELTCAAFRQAIQTSREAMQKELQAATGGLNVQGMMDMLNQ